MSPIDPTSLSPSTLSAALATWAHGLYRREAAVGLLIAHDVWPRRNDFLTACVLAFDEDDDPADGTTVTVSIDWNAARRLADTAAALPGETAILRLATAIAAEDLGGFVASLDPPTVALVLDSLAHTMGWHQSSVTHHVTGTIGAPPSYRTIGGAW